MTPFSLRLASLINVLALVTASVASFAVPSPPASKAPQSAFPRLVLQFGHNGEIGSIASSRDGSLIATGGRDGSICVWQSSTGLLRTSLRPNGGWIYSLSISPDGRTVAAGDEQGRVTFWDTQTGAACGSTTLSANVTAVFAVAWSPNGRQIAAGSVDGAVRIWDAQTHRAIRSWRFAGNGIDSLSYSPNGKFLAVGLGKGVESAPGMAMEPRIDLRSVYTGKLVRSLNLGAVPTCVFGFSPDSSTVTAYSAGSMLASYATADGTLQNEWDSGNYSPLAIAYSSDGKMLETTGYGGVIKIWDPVAGKVSRTITGLTPYGGSIAATWVGDSNTLSAGTHVGDILFWDGTDCALVRAIDGYARPEIDALAVSADGRTIAATLATPCLGADGAVALVDSQTGSVARAVPLETSAVGVAFLPVGASVVAVDNNSATSYGVADGTLLRHLYSSKTDDLYPKASFSGNGHFLVLARNSGPVELCSPWTGALRSVILVAPGTTVVGFAATPDGKRVATVTRRDSIATLTVWDIASSKPAINPVNLTTQSDTIPVAVSPDGKLIVCGGEVRAADTGDLVARLGSDPRTVAFSRDSRTLVNDQGLVWDSWKRTPRAHLAIPDGCNLKSVAVTADGTRIIGGCDDGAIRTFDSTTGALLLTEYILPSYTGKPDARDWLAITPTAQYACSPAAERYVAWQQGSTITSSLPAGYAHYHVAGLVGDVMGPVKVAAKVSGTKP